MALIMKKFIDVLQLPLSKSPTFTVDITKKFVPVTDSILSAFGIWASNYRQHIFQNRDNIQVLSIGVFMPENFAFTSIDAPIFDNTIALPVAPVTGDAYTALVDANTWVAGNIYEYDGAAWQNKDFTFPGTKFVLEVTNVEGDPGVALPGFGSSIASAFALPFPNYELVFEDLYCDIANIPVSDLALDTFYLQGTVSLPNVSMIGVPSALDGRIMRIIPFIKIAHTCSLDHDPLP